MELKMAFFPMEEDGVGGALCFSKHYKPTSDGAVIYLNANPDISIPLSKVEAAGRKVMMPKKLITEAIGYMVLFIDSEGK